MKCGKATGIDNITTEELVASTQGIGQKIIHMLCQKAWEKEEVPSEWKKSVIVPIHRKQDKLDCTNYRGISLLCHSAKVFSSS